MQVILFRHGTALPRSPGLRDAERPLTDDGIRKTAKAIKGLAKLIDKPDVVLTSPLIRAQQTAEIVAEQFGIAPTEEPLLAEGRPTSVVKALGNQSGETVIAVGHEPDLSGAAELLCFRQIKGRLVLKKAGAVCLQTVARRSATDASAELIWLATPRMLRKIA